MKRCIVTFNMMAMAAVCAVAADGGRTVCGMGAEEPKEWKVWSFRLPAESGYGEIMRTCRCIPASVEKLWYNIRRKNERSV